MARERKTLTVADVRKLRSQGYKLTEWVHVKGKTFVNLVTPAGAPRTRRVTLDG